MKTAILTPAYTRPTSESDVLAMFNSGKDFIIQNIMDRWSGKPCNIRDLKKYSDYSHAELRFGANFDQCTLIRLED